MATQVIEPKQPTYYQAGAPFQAGPSNGATTVYYVQQQPISQGSWTGTMVKTAVFVGALGVAFYLGHQAGVGKGTNDLLDALGEMNTETGKSFLEGLKRAGNELSQRATLLTEYGLNSFNINPSPITDLGNEIKQTVDDVRWYGGVIGGLGIGTMGFTFLNKVVQNPIIRGAGNFIGFVATHTFGNRLGHH